MRQAGSLSHELRQVLGTCQRNAWHLSAQRLFNEIETALTALVLFNDVTGYAQKTGLALVCPADLWHLSSIPQFVVFINYLLKHRDRVGLLEFPVPKLGK